MKKYPSKRRWLARFRMGKPVPWFALKNYNDLITRCKPFILKENSDHIVRRTDIQGGLTPTGRVC